MSARRRKKNVMGAALLDGLVGGAAAGAAFAATDKLMAGRLSRNPAEPPCSSCAHSEVLALASREAPGTRLTLAQLPKALRRNSHVQKRFAAVARRRGVACAELHCRVGDPAKGESLLAIEAGRAKCHMRDGRCLPLEVGVDVASGREVLLSSRRSPRRAP